MSDYDAYARDRERDRDDHPRRHRSTRYYPRDRDRDDADYVEETTYIERGKGPPPRDLMLRPSRDDSVEDIHRDFPPPNSRRRGPPGYDDYDDYGPRRTRSARGYDDDYSDYAAGAAGGYAAGRSRRDRPRRRDSYSDDESPRRPERRKSGIEKTLEGLGLGGVVGALSGQRSRSSDTQSRRGDRRRDDSRSRSGSRERSKGNKTQRQWTQAAQAALVAGAIAAFQSRKEPGSWTGEKGKRIATAAISAGGIDRLIGGVSGRDPEHHSGRHIVESVIGGLAANRLANGPSDKGKSEDGRGRSRSRSRARSIMDRFRSKSRGASKSRDRDRSSSRSPSRSRSRGATVAGLAAAGGAAAVGKKLYDRWRSKSRGGDKERKRSTSSRDSYDASRNRGRRDVGRSRSMPPDQARAADEGAVVGPRGRAIGAGGGAGALAQSDKKRDGSNSSSDTESEAELISQQKKMRGKELLTAGLATIATIHAAHGVYQSMESSDRRHKAVAEGKITKEEARRKRSKAWLQDAAAVGIAALGIKGAYSEWKEMNEQRHTIKELDERRRNRQKRRAKRERERREHGLPPLGSAPLRQSLPAPDRYYPEDDIPPPPMGSGGPPNGGHRY